MGAPTGVLQDGDIIDVGEYHFRCIHTPGHSLGHTGLYEPEKKILVAGNHILIDITPNIQCWSEIQNLLKSYLESLDRVHDLDVELTLPGHRRLITDHAAESPNSKSIIRNAAMKFYASSPMAISRPPRLHPG